MLNLQLTNCARRNYQRRNCQRKNWKLELVNAKITKSEQLKNRAFSSPIKKTSNK